MFGMFPLFMLPSFLKLSDIQSTWVLGVAEWTIEDLACRELKRSSYFPAFPEILLRNPVLLELLMMDDAF